MLRTNSLMNLNEYFEVVSSSIWYAEFTENRGDMKRDQCITHLLFPIVWILVPEPPFDL